MSRPFDMSEIASIGRVLSGETKWAVLNHDSLSVLPLLIPDRSIGMVFTDPPYGHNNNNGDLISRREAALGRGDYQPARDNRPIANDGVEANDLFRAIL